MPDKEGEYQFVGETYVYGLMDAEAMSSLSEEEIERMTCWERPPQKYVLGRDEPWVRFTPLYFDNGAHCIYAAQIQSESTVLQAP